MKIIRDSIGSVFAEYMTKLIGKDSSIKGEKASEVGFQLLSLIVEASYTLSDEASATFHAAMGSCNVGRKDIAKIINAKRMAEGKHETNQNAVKSNLNYARKIIRDYLDKEIIHINV